MPEIKRNAIERGRAKFAYDCVTEVVAISKNKEYKAYAKKLPMMIKTNGLGAALAFCRSKISDDTSKSGYAYKKLYEHITEWMKQDDKQLLELSATEDLVEKVVSLEDSSEYRAVTVEVLAFLTWLRRFAEGLIEGEADV
jgi:CRISPR-associated protein Cmr5